MAEHKSPHPDLMGWLFKWTNYLKGYQKRWFVLSNGVLSYYRVPTKRTRPRFLQSFRRKRRKSPNEMNQQEANHTCRGSVTMHNAIITTTDSLSFTISNGGHHTFHIRAMNETTRQKWLSALGQAKTCRIIESEEDEEFNEASGVNTKTEYAEFAQKVSTMLSELQTCNDVIPKHWNALHRSLSEMESTSLANVSVREVSERAALFRITCTAFANKCSDFHIFVQREGKKWQRMLQHERDQRQRLEQIVEQLARQHSSLEEAAKSQTPRGTVSTLSDEDDENEFFDATSFEDEGPGCDFNINIGDASGSSSEAEDIVDSKRSDPREMKYSFNHALPSKSHEAIRYHMDDLETTSALQNVNDTGASLDSFSTKTLKKGRQRRIRIPDKPYYPLSLWSIMKNCIGKELSKIPMPVNFSEPISMLQRLAEDFEYSAILDTAAKCQDNWKQMAYVAAFTVSSYATTAVRSGKPFNPLLGETYECDRMEDLGWRSFSEQVSHHPPMFAQFCEGQQWESWQEFTMASKFRGKYLEVIPLGISHLQFKNSGNHYTWRKVTTLVHNIIVGKLWVDQSGEMEIKNHTTGDVCVLKFTPYSYFSKHSQRKVKGFVKDASGDMKYVIQGSWDAKIDIAPVISSNGFAESSTYKTGGFESAWELNPPNPGCEKFYNFSLLACQLNEPEEGVAPTDSRLRPDQRLMEDGRWDEANNQKVRLEEKQRAVRRARDAEVEEAAKRGEELAPYEPVWFRREMDAVTGGPLHMFNREYWSCKSRQDWSRCPNIF